MTHRAAAEAMNRIVIYLSLPVLLCVLAVVASCGRSAPRAKKTAAIPCVAPRIVGTIPHDSLSFTQGLFYHDERLYESAGLYGKSILRVLDARSGAPLASLGLPSHVFAEGCARKGDDLVQLTWREQTAFVYSFPGLALRGTVGYSGGGWGLTADSAFFYMSNGSDTLFIRTASFEVARRVAVRSRGRPLTNLNELEYVKGRVFANVWYSDYLYEIDPKSGTCLRLIDCSGLIERERPASPDNVLNGIAYDPRGGLFYLTGKNWKTIFIVEIPGV